jgi:hypothetical protein
MLWDVEWLGEITWEERMGDEFWTCEKDWIEEGGETTADGGAGAGRRGLRDGSECEERSGGGV